MSAAREEPWIAVGVVARPHGVRGELRVHMHNKGSEVLLRVREIELEGHGQGTGSPPHVRQRFVVTGARPEREAILLRIRGCDTRDAAEKLRGVSILVPRAALPPPEPDEYYFCDLVGLAVVDPDGAALGRVEDVLEGSGHAILVVRRETRTIEVPLADTWVVSVDISAGRIVIRDLDALAL